MRTPPGRALTRGEEQWLIRKCRNNEGFRPCTDRDHVTSAIFGSCTVIG